MRIEGFSGCAGQPLELDPDTGAIYAAAAVRKGGGWEIHTSLPSIGSRLFVAPKRRQGRVPACRPQLRTIRSTAMGGKSWDIRLSEANNLVLDRPRFKIGNAGWQKAEEILRIDRLVRDALGLQHRGGAMAQPWARPQTAEPRRTTVVLKYGFDVRAIPSGELFLAVEQPATFRIEVNGAPVSVDAEAGWWCDRAVRKIPLDGGLLCLGRNEIAMTCDYTEQHPGLEIVYILGQFGTAVRQTDVCITRAPTALKIGNWVGQGLAFYSGSVAYCCAINPKRRKGERLFVKVPGYRGAAVRVLVNGRSAGIMAWEPNEVDITGLLTDGANQIVIEVVGHRRNSHGPLHYAVKWPVDIGPGKFTTRDERWLDGYRLVPCGMTKPPQLVRRAE